MTTFEMFFSIVEHIGVCAFAISGALVAIDRETDIFGVVFLSFITTFGGGILRDILLGFPEGLPKFFTPSYLSLILACLATSIAVLLFAMLFKKRFIHDEKLLDYINNFIDAVGIGAFTVSGAMIAINAGYDNAFIAIFMGMTTCIGGGILRDIMLNDVPFVLRKRIYAIACIAGAGVFYLIRMIDKQSPLILSVAMTVGALTTIAIRVLATVFKWNAPKAINFSKLRAELASSTEQQDEEITQIEEKEKVAK